jgi:short-subunit dehydrogenase
MNDKQEKGRQKKGWALVTGASAGIGEEFCNQLAALSYSVVLVARRKDKLEQIARHLGAEHGVDCRCYPMDLSQPGAMGKLCEALAADAIEIEFLVNNAGYGVPGLFNEADWQIHADSLQLMLNSVCELSWRVLPGMQQRGKGYIVNVASLAGLVPGSARHTLYGAIKVFLIRFSESLSMENQDTGVAVSALCPGFTHSEFHDVAGSRELVSQMSSYMWMNADEVVRFGISSVMQQPPLVVAVPGRVNRFIASMFKLLPRKTGYYMIRRQSRRYRDAG